MLTCIALSLRLNSTVVTAVVTLAVGRKRQKLTFVQPVY